MGDCRRETSLGGEGIRATARYYDPLRQPISPLSPLYCVYPGCRTWRRKIGKEHEQTPTHRSLSVARDTVSRPRLCITTAQNLAGICEQPASCMCSEIPDDQQHCDQIVEPFPQQRLIPVTRSVQSLRTAGNGAEFEVPRPGWSRLIAHSDIRHQSHVDDALD